MYSFIESHAVHEHNMICKHTLKLGWGVLARRDNFTWASVDSDQVMTWWRKTASYYLIER